MPWLAPHPNKIGFCHYIDNCICQCFVFSVECFQGSAVLVSVQAEEGLRVLVDDPRDAESRCDLEQVRRQSLIHAS